MTSNFLGPASGCHHESSRPHDLSSRATLASFNGRALYNPLLLFNQFLSDYAYAICTYVGRVTGNAMKRPRPRCKLRSIGKRPRRHLSRYTIDLLSLRCASRLPRRRFTESLCAVSASPSPSPKDCWAVAPLAAIAPTPFRCVSPSAR